MTRPLALSPLPLAATAGLLGEVVKVTRSRGLARVIHRPPKIITRVEGRCLIRARVRAMVLARVRTRDKARIRVKVARSIGLARVINRPPKGRKG